MPIQGYILALSHFCCFLGQTSFLFLIDTSSLHEKMVLSFKMVFFFPQGARFCDGNNFHFIEGSISCHDYQEIKIQESSQVLGVGSIPRSIRVVLMDDLVDIVKAGGNPLSLNIFLLFSIFSCETGIFWMSYHSWLVVCYFFFFDNHLLFNLHLHFLG